MARMRGPRYIGEDRRLTSEKELRGWYSYGMAAEVFAVCGVGSFLPVTLEQLARERGVLRSDKITPCSQASSGGAVRRDLWNIRRDTSTQDDNICIIHLLGSEINTASFAMYTFSLAVFVQALTLVSISAIADHGNHRKRFLLILAYVGSIACMLFIFVGPQIYLLAPFLVVIAVTCLGSSFVLLNSFLPLLVSNHPSLSRFRKSPTSDTFDEDLEMINAANQLDQSDDDDDRRFDASLERKQETDATPELTLSNRISSKGIGLGYAAAVFVQTISIGILLLFSSLSLTSSTTLPMRVVLCLVGMWWAAFTVPTAFWLRQRPGPPMPSLTLTKYRPMHWISYVSFAWLALWDTIRVAMRLRQVSIFLLAWFLLSDSIATVSGTAILFARTELRMGTASTAALSVTATLAGIAGAFYWPRIANRFNLDTKHTIMACVVSFEIIPLYGLLAYIPFIKAWGVGGLQTSWEIFPLGFIHGFVMGGLSSLCRSFYGVLIPPGGEAAFYALYAVTDKGSSIIGPAIVGRIVDKTGSIRPAFWFLAILIILPIFFIRWIDVEQGRRDAIEMAGKIKGPSTYSHEEGDGAEETEEGLLSDESS